MKPILSVALLFALAVPSLAAETVFTQAFGTAIGPVHADGDMKYSMTVFNGTKTFKCVNVNSVSAHLHSQWHDQDGQQHRVGMQFVMRGDLSGGWNTAETFLAVWRTDYSAVIPYVGASIHSRVTGIVTEFAPGKYRITDDDDSKAYDILLPATVHGEVGKLAAAVSSGQPITLGGTIGFRGNGSLGNQEDYFVVDDFVD
jgi:hypothetical protein